MKRYKKIIQHTPNKHIQKILAIEQCRIIEIGIDEMPENINKMRFIIDCKN